MKRTVAALVALAAAACSPSPSPTTEPSTCSGCAPGSGGVRVALAVTIGSVTRVRATVAGPGIAVPITQDLAVIGSVASGTIPDVPAGAVRTVTLEAFPAAPEADLVIYRGSATTQVEPGLLAEVSITLWPVVKDLAVTATFTPGDLDLASVHHVAVSVSGDRIAWPATSYLSVNVASGTATGTAPAVPVGASRTVTVRAYDAGGALLHEGAAEVAVLEGTTPSATVPLANQGGTGSIGVIGGFCNPDCTGRTCGDDGCGGSCGGCQPGDECVAHACAAPPPPPSGPASWRTVLLLPAENPSAVWAVSPGDVWIARRTELSHWDGSTWTTTALVSSVPGNQIVVEALWGSAADDVWAVGSDRFATVPDPHEVDPLGLGTPHGALLHWDGTTWTTHLAATTGSFGTVWGTGPGDVWAIGRGAAAHWDGAQWSEHAFGVEYDQVNGLWASGPDDYWAVGWSNAGSLVKHWDGNAWSDRGGLPVRAYLHDVWGSSSTDVWTVGNTNTESYLLHWNGSGWSSTNLGTKYYYALWGSGPDDVWALGSFNAPALHWNGSGWSSVPMRADTQFMAVSGSGPDDVWGIGWYSQEGGSGVVARYSP